MLEGGLVIGAINVIFGVALLWLWGEEAMTPAQQRAWLAYYQSLANDPTATEEERKRGKDMLAKGEWLGIRDLDAINPEDLA